MDFVLLIAGIAGLWIGTELTIGGALAIARRHRISEFFVGLVILSIGSDLPELAIAIDAGFQTLHGADASGVVVGTSIGSLMGQIGLVLGLGGVISFLTLPRSFIFRHGTTLIISTVLLFLLAWDGQITRIEGMVLVLAYALYVVALLNGENAPEQEPEKVASGGLQSWMSLAAGLALVIYSSDLTVASAVAIAEALQISEALIAVLIIGVGSSLPELSISIAALLKKRMQMSVGNIIGSNVLDTLLPIGVAALISPVRFERQMLFFDLPFVLVLTLVVFAFFLKKDGIGRPQGLVVLGLYGIYVLLKLLQF